MKKALIVCPNFPPNNTADCHRIRMGLKYFEELGWEVLVLCVDPQYIEAPVDPHLLKTIPEKINVYRVRAFNPNTTRKFGFSSLALRSIWFLYKKGSSILQNENIDLVYFSTTMFNVLPLGRLWKRRFGVPYIIDMQDPWRSDHYLKVPPAERPPKFWLAYQLDSRLEGYTMKKVDGIVSVSKDYPDVLMKRYQNIIPEMCVTIPFGAAIEDFDLAKGLGLQNNIFKADDQTVNIVYVGRGGHDLSFALKALFKAYKRGLDADSFGFSKVRFYFVGTSYAATGMGQQTVKPIAMEMGIEEGIVTEVTDRVSYFEAIKILLDADVLIMPGSSDHQYTASKVFPYVLAQKPLIAIFNQNSSVCQILSDASYGSLIKFDDQSTLEEVTLGVLKELKEVLNSLPREGEVNWEGFMKYSAYNQTQRQTVFFEKTLNRL